MVETRRSSSTSKRFCSFSSSLEQSSSSPRPTKRCKVNIDAAIESVAAAELAGSSSVSEVPAENQGQVSDPGSESGELEVGSSDPQAMDAEKPVLTDVPVMEISLEADTKPEADVLTTPRVIVVTDSEKSKAEKKRAKAPWVKLLSQYSQTQTWKSNKKNAYIKTQSILETQKQPS